MKYASAVVLSYLLYASLNILCANSQKTVSCPSKKYITPCICGAQNGEAAMLCANVHSVRTLRNIAKHSANHAFKAVEILNSTLAYLPHEFLKTTSILFFNVWNTTLFQLFDEPPAGASSVKTLTFLNLAIARRNLWDQLETFTNLDTLMVEGTPIKILGASFKEHVSKGLKTLSFSQTSTRKIMPGTLVPFKKLNYIYIRYCNLTNLTRDIFPNPFNVEVLSFSYNQIEEIPIDLFVNMPQLHSVDLDRNPIKTIPLSAFNGHGRRLPSILLWEDKLECDCNIKWIFENYDSDELQSRGGTCSSPDELENKKFGYFGPEMIQCA